MFDLDAVIAEDQPKEPFEFTFGGQQFRLPGEPDVRPLALLTKGQIYDGLRILMGEDQWGRLLEADATFGVSHLTRLIEAYTQHAGLDLGESAAS